MNIRYRVDMEDLVAFSQHHLDTSVQVHKQRRTSIAVVMGIYLALGCINVMISSSFAPLAVWIGIAVVYALWFNSASRKVNPKRVARLYSDGKNRGSLCEHRLEILPEGLRETTDVGEQTCTFSGIERIESNNTHAFIYLGSMMAHIVPKGKLLEGDLDLFLSTLKEKMATAAETSPV